MSVIIMPLLLSLTHTISFILTHNQACTRVHTHTHTTTHTHTHTHTHTRPDRTWECLQTASSISWTLSAMCAQSETRFNAI